MGIVLLVIHVLGAVLFIGPAAVTSSLFPRYVPVTDPDGSSRDLARSLSVAAALQRIARTYGMLALVVPAAGLVLGILWDKFSQGWLIAAMVLTAAAGVLFAALIVPTQRRLLTEPAPRANLTRLGIQAGIFNLLWVAVLVLMLVQPGAPEE